MVLVSDTALRERAARDLKPRRDQRPLLLRAPERPRREAKDKEEIWDYLPKTNFKKREKRETTCTRRMHVLR